MFLRAFRRVNGNDMIPADLNLPMAKYTQDDSAFGAIITSAVYLPRIQLFGGNSDLVKEGKIGMGHYGLVRSKDQVDDLGVQFNCCPFSWRFKAVRITEANDVFSYFNPNADEFKAIMVESEQQDSGCMYGVEFLTWIPDPTATFATFFFASKTARRESPNLKQILTNRGAATCKAQLIKKGRFTWHGPVIVPCSTPFELPPSDEIMTQAERFANPKDSEVEKAEVVGEVRER